MCSLTMWVLVIQPLKNVSNFNTQIIQTTKTEQKQQLKQWPTFCLKQVLSQYKLINSENIMKKTLGILIFLITGVANATIITADFRTESDLPYCCNDAGPLVYENIGAILNAGYELDDDNFVSNDSSWSGGVVYVDLDKSTNIVTLDSQDVLDFEIFDLWVSNIVFDAGEIITGVSLISGNITDLGITALLSFTDNSIHISYDVGDGNSTFNFNELTATFQITTSTSDIAVPAPASFLLLTLGIAFITISRRKKIR